MKKKYFSILALTAILISSTVFYNPTSASSNGFEQGNQYMSGAYDKQGESPTPYNWTRTSPFYSVESNPTLKWELDLGGYVRGNPTIGSDGTIYVSSATGYINAINNDGTLNWRYMKKGTTDSNMGLSVVISKDGTLLAGSHAINPDGTPKWVYDQVGTDHTNHKTTALDSNGNAYYTSPLSKLFSLDQDGNLNWSLQVINKNDTKVLSSPAIGADGTIYVAISGGVGVEKPGILAVNPDGTIKWRLEVENTAKPTLSYGGFGSIVIGKDGTLYFGLTSTFYAVNPDGTVKWSYKPTHEVSTGPAIGIDGSIIFGAMDKHIHSLNEDGTLNWKYLMAGYTNIAPIVDKNGNIYFQSGFKVQALTSIGKFLWSYEVPGINNSGSLAIGKDGTIYSVHGNKLTAIFGDVKKDVNYCEISTDLKNLTEEDLNSQEAIDKAKMDLQDLKDALNELENKINRAESSQQ